MADSIQEYKPQEENENMDKITNEFANKVEVGECKRDEQHKEDEKKKQHSGDEDHESTEKDDNITTTEEIKETVTGESEPDKEKVNETIAGETKEDHDAEEIKYEDAKSHEDDDDKRELEDGTDDDLQKGLVDSIKEKLPIGGAGEAEQAQPPAAAEVDYGGKEKKGLVGKIKEKITGITQPKANEDKEREKESK